MSRGVPYNPVSENQSTDIFARPTLINAVTVPYDPICRQQTGDQTAVPDLPPTN